MRGYSKLWEFNTAKFTVTFEVAPEDTDPADSFDLDEDIEAVRSGAVEWFIAAVVVYLRETGERVGWDTLGGCAYKTFKDFYTSHRDADPMNRNCTIMRKVNGEKTCICHYFPSLVGSAVQHAREQLAREQNDYPDIKLRGM